MDDWGEDDDEFEKSLIDYELSPCKTKNVITNYQTDLKPTREGSQTQCLAERTGPTSSTPIQAVQNALNYHEKKKLEVSSSITTVSISEHIKSTFRKPDEPPKRRFPGPAGRLPKLKRSVDLARLKHQSVEANSERNKLDPDTVCSQPSQRVSVTSSSSWNNLVEDLDLTTAHLEKHNIKNAMQTALKGMLPDGKVPLLIVLVESVDKTLPDAVVQLRDQTGSMTGVIHRLLAKQYQNEIASGASLLLHRTSVFQPCPRKHYLNITPNNLLRIYPDSQASHHIYHIQINSDEPELREMLAQPTARPPNPPALVVNPKSLFSTSTETVSRGPLHNSTNTHNIQGVALSKCCKNRAVGTDGTVGTNGTENIVCTSTYSPSLLSTEVCSKQCEITLHQGAGCPSLKETSSRSCNLVSDIFDEDDLSDLDLSLVM